MFFRDELGAFAGGSAAAASTGTALVLPPQTALARTIDQLRAVDWTPDLGARIGSRDWWRGLATCAGLVTLTCLLAPGFERPIYGAAPARMVAGDWDEARAQGFAPAALGAASGRRMGAVASVAPLTDTPERPRIELAASLGLGDRFERVLTRAGVSASDAGHVADMVAGAVALGEIRPGTRLDLTLGRRADKSQPRPLEKLAFRARFDLNLAVTRGPDGLALERHPIAIDHTPLRIQGRVGTSLYRAARAAGAPAKAVETYLKAIASRVPIAQVDGDDSFDIIVEQARAATGEVQLGSLLFAGLDRSGAKAVKLVRWQEQGRPQWFDANGAGEKRGTSVMPVSGRISSPFGARRHPLLGFLRMHKGLDIAAPHGTPVRAMMDGVVAAAGRAGGYGNLIKLGHGRTYQSMYGHLSRIAVRPGERVSRGEIIGYVGSTGLSTGPHLHFEVLKNGRAVNPRSMSIETQQQLAGEELARFKAQVKRLMGVPVGGSGN